MPKSKAYANPLPSHADEQRYSAKCQELRTKIREIERENQIVQLKIVRSKKNIQRLRIERSVLYDALATITTCAAQSSGLAPSSNNPPQTSSLHPIGLNHQEAPQSTTPTPQNLQNPHSSSHETLAAPIHTSTTPIDDLHPTASVSGTDQVTSIEAPNTSSSNGVSGALNSTGININGHTAATHNQYPPHISSANHYHQNQQVEPSAVEPTTASTPSAAQTNPLQTHHSLNHDVSPTQPTSSSTGHFQHSHQPQPAYLPSNHSAPTSATGYHAPYDAYQDAHQYPTSTSPSVAGIDTNGDRHMVMPTDPRDFEDAGGAGSDEGSEGEEEEGEQEVEGMDQQGSWEEAEEEEEAEEVEGADDNGVQHPMSHNFQEHVAMETSGPTY
ncbi:hypothetical protein DFH28DRAFT_1083081 [Melampsora americana]|nr:hypothetical protein DFH28DRAFT_1083081 [Melampsora americana]